MLGTKRKFRPWSVVATLFLAVALVAGGWGLSQRSPSLVAADRVTRTATEMKDALSLQKVFVETVRDVNPAVVSVQVEGSPEGPMQGPPFRRFGPGDAPDLEEWFRQFGFGPPFQPQEMEGMGSGMIIRADGYVVTNNHVVQGARRISVRLDDEREYPATLVGTDPRTDVAVLKIKADKPLPTVELGDSDQIEVGQWAIAVGNPFGFEHTVTVGVISAKGRETTLDGPASYQDYIQTDASINPGHSGGPLVDLYGRVIGINNHIFTRTGSSVGIGFAIPINNARPVIEELIQKGKVTRGRIGVEIKNVTPEMAEAMGLSEARGALVNSVEPGSPAEQAGVQAGDVITAFDGQPIQKTLDLVKRVAQSPVGEKRPLTVWREGKEITLQIRIAELPAEAPVGPSAEKGDAWGLAVQPVPPDLAREWKLSPGEGVLVAGVEPGSPADRAGLQEGDVILWVNRQVVHNPEELRQALQSARKSGRSVALRVVRQGHPDFLVLPNPAGEEAP
jgi:serine protease Do